MKHRGLYIVIEGHDGTGKSTQVELLRKRLLVSGVESIEFQEPAGTPIADKLRTIIKDGSLHRNPLTDLLMFSAARCEIWESIALSALNSGKFVVASRNWWSTEAYQGYGDGIDLKTIEKITKLATDDRYMKPDLGIILSLDSAKERRERISGRGKLLNPDAFESRPDGFQMRVQRGYLDIANRHGAKIVEASQAVDQVADEIWRIVEKFLADSRTDVNLVDTL